MNKVSEVKNIVRDFQRKSVDDLVQINLCLAQWIFKIQEI